MTPQYDRMIFRRCGSSGLQLPLLSLGLWHNFGSIDPFDTARTMILNAFESGVTHFDLANNYGPEPGTAETTFGKILKTDLAGHRDELIISTKAGYLMWPGPYGDGGSRKYLLASLDQSLRRMGVEYVDIFYHHRPDPDTPMEESLMAVDHAVKTGKAIYAGISSYNTEQTKKATEIFRELRTPFIIHQVKYNIFYREPEHSLLGTLEQLGVGCIVFSPLAQGLLSDRYIEGIPPDSRAAKPSGFLKADQITAERRQQIIRLSAVAKDNGLSMAQIALAWVLRHRVVTSAIIGASSIRQVEENLSVLKKPDLSGEILNAIDDIVR
jgi:L-glyceraldehyde 3-phosphate reductase